MLRHFMLDYKGVHPWRVREGQFYHSYNACRVNADPSLQIAYPR